MHHASPNNKMRLTLPSRLLPKTSHKPSKKATRTLADGRTPYSLSIPTAASRKVSCCYSRTALSTTCSVNTRLDWQPRFPNPWAGLTEALFVDGLILQTSIIAVTSRWGTSVRHMPDASFTAFVEHRCCKIYIILPLSGTPSSNGAVRRPHRPIACLFREFAALTKP